MWCDYFADKNRKVIFANAVQENGMQSKCDFNLMNQ